MRNDVCNSWHRDPPTPEVQTPILNQLVETGIELNRFYTWKACSPTRSALQTGRYPLHVNMHNADPLLYNASSASGKCASRACMCVPACVCACLPAWHFRHSLTHLPLVLRAWRATQVLVLGFHVT